MTWNGCMWKLWGDGWRWILFTHGARTRQVGSGIPHTQAGSILEARCAHRFWWILYKILYPPLFFFADMHCAIDFLGSFLVSPWGFWWRFCDGNGVSSLLLLRLSYLLLWSLSPSYTYAHTYTRINVLVTLSKTSFLDSTFTIRPPPSKPPLELHLTQFHHSQNSFVAQRIFCLHTGLEEEILLGILFGIG